MLDSKYIADSKLPVNNRALDSCSVHEREALLVPDFQCSPCQEEIPNAGAAPVESRAWSKSFDDLKIDHIEKAAYELLLG